MGAFEALMTAAHHRQDPVAYRRWWERGHQVATASGQRYLQLLAEAHRGLVPGAWDDDDELIEHHERLESEIGEYGDPMLMFISANTFASVLHHAGHTDRARAVAHSAIDPGRRAGPISHCATLMTSASIDALSGGDSDHASARAAATEALRIARDEGLTSQALQTVFIAAALTAQRDDIDHAAVLLSAAARHADPLGIGGHPLTHACRVHAQAAVDAYPADLTAPQRRGAAMTLEDLTTYTLNTLT